MTTTTLPFREVAALYDYLRRLPGGRVVLAGLDGFYRAHPEASGAFKGRIRRVAESYPQLFTCETVGRSEYICVVDSTPLSSGSSLDDLIVTSDANVVREWLSASAIPQETNEEVTNAMFIDVYAPPDQDAVSHILLEDDTGRVLVVDVSESRDLSAFLETSQLRRSVLENERLTKIVWDSTLALPPAFQASHVAAIRPIWDLSRSHRLLHHHSTPAFREVFASYDVPLSPLPIHSVSPSLLSCTSFETAALLSRPFPLAALLLMRQAAMACRALYIAMREDAYSTDRLHRCLEASATINTTAISSPPAGTPLLCALFNAHDEELRRARPFARPAEKREERARLLANAGYSPQHCYFFHLGGGCKTGDSCKFLH